MTLVYRSPKGQNIKTPHDLGPGSYNLTPNNQINKKIINESSMFASTSKRDPFEIKKQKQNTKIEEKPQQNDSLTEINQIQQISHLTKKYPDCQHVFNSKVQRFKSPNSEIETQQNMKQLLMIEEFRQILVKDMKNSNKGRLIKTKDKTEKQNQLRGDNYQFFPSIPNWESSFGYRYDSSSAKWIANQNPNILLKLMEYQNKQEKNNVSLGAGYYIPKNKQNKLQKKNNLNSKEKSLTDSIIYPKIKQRKPVSNSIQETQLRLKAKIRLLGKSPLKKTQQKFGKTQNVSSSQFFDGNQKDKKQNLILNQMIKKFGQFIPQHQKASPQKFIQKLKEKKQKVLKQKNSPSKKQNNSEDSQLHFLSKSFRFQVKEPQNPKPEETNNNETNNENQGSTMILKSHNCKQTLLLGEKRFKQNYKTDPLGPGSYKNENGLDKNKSSPCLNLKQKRFIGLINKNQLPGPGQYNISEDILKRQNPHGYLYSFYKELKKQQIGKNLKRQDSMQTLYSSWGRQMNYMAKLECNSTNRQCQFQYKTQQPHEKQKSMIKIRNELQQQLKKNQVLVEIQKNSQKINKQKSESCIPKIYPKITKHLYKYKPLPNDQKTQNMGPGKYEIQPKMIKKTFNVTYT